jgi:hypothetical protein
LLLKEPLPRDKAVRNVEMFRGSVRGRTMLPYQQVD